MHSLVMLLHIPCITPEQLMIFGVLIGFLGTIFGFTIGVILKGEKNEEPITSK